MVSTENGEYKDEIQEDLEMGTTGTKMRLMDYIPIYIPTVEKGLLDQSRHEKRFLDFLRAHPSKDWFLRSGFVGRLSPFSFLRRNGSPGDESSPSEPAHSRVRLRFRVPFVRKISWAALIRYLKNWIKNPVNMAFLVWLIFVVVGLIMLGLVMLGILNGAIPSSSRRKRWSEVINQILNALFTIMCLYQHPKLFHQLVLLLRWRSPDKVEVRKIYCKGGVPRPHERAHMMLVVILLHITCFSQYVLCGLYWGYTRKTRPDWAENLCIGVGIAAPVIAGVYTVYSPLGRRYDESETQEETQHQEATTTQPNQTEVKLYNRRVVVTSPQWIGGLFDCRDDLTVCSLSFFCTFCVFGWNMERLGFGNMYVHMITFILLIIAPFWVFNVSALNVDDETIRYIVAITGIVLCFFGLLYGGFWRMQMRKRFKLPANPFCCGHPSVTDFMQWLFCWSCSLAQEVRTGNFYDIEDDSFYQKATDENGRPVLVPLPRESGSVLLISGNIDYPVRSYSCPPKIEPSNIQMSSDILKDGSQPGFSTTIERSSTCGTAHMMRPPIPPLIQLEDN